MTSILAQRSRVSHRVRMAALLGGAVFMLATPVLAQSAASSKADASTSVEQIIVTATGRRALLQQVPVAVTAVTAQTVKNAGITDLKTLQEVVPSYRIQEGQSNAAGATALIRGIGTGGDNPGFESAVGFFIDGVYRNRAGVAFSELPEVDRIEVLEGPQGTLFGRNTSAGAISVTTKAPEFSERGYLDLTYGNYNNRQATFGFTGPLDANHVLAGKIDGSYQQRDGYIKDVDTGQTLNNRNRWNVRGQLLWDINANATLRLIADTSNTNEQCCSAVTAVDGATAPAVIGIAGLGGGAGLITPPNPNALQTTVTPGRDLLEKVNEFGFSGQLDWNLGGVKMTAISSYRDWKVNRDQDIDFSDLDRAYRQGYKDEFKTFTEELRFQGKNGPLDWLVGGYYADETLNHVDNIKFGSQAAQYVDALAGGAAPGYNIYGSLGNTGCGPAIALFPTCSLLASSLYQGTAGARGVPTANALLPVFNAFGNAVAASAPLSGQGQNHDTYQTHTRSLAFFTHDEYDLTKDLTLTVGLRFNHEDKDFTATLPPTTGSACAVYQNTTPIPGTGGLTYNQLAASLLNTPLGGILTLTCNPEVNGVANGVYAEKTTENELTGTAALRYHPTQNLMVYASYSRGYKAGGFDLDRAGFPILPTTTVQPTANDLHFAPEFVNAYEIGVKSTLFNGVMILDGDIFYEDISNYQDNVFSGFDFLTKNVARVISRGVEANATYRATSDLTFQAGVLYNEAYVDSTTNFNTPGAAPVSGDIIPTGTVLPDAPKWTVTASMSYRHMLPQTNLLGFLYLDAHYSSYYTTATLSDIPAINQGALTLVNGRIGLGPLGGHWSTEVFVSNMFDQRYNAYAFGVPEQTGTYDVYPGVPRMFGATLKLKF